jgi:hypothetical protein
MSRVRVHVPTVCDLLERVVYRQFVINNCNLNCQLISVHHLSENHDQRILFGYITNCLILFDYITYCLE